MMDYGIGGTEAKQDVNEGIADIPQNRTLFIQKLTGEAPLSADVVHGLKKFDEVFDHFEPNIDIEFSDEEGMPVEENLKFKGLGDFGSKGIIKQSQFLQNLDYQQDQYNKIIKHLKSNRVLRKVMEDKDAKQAMIQSVSALMAELEDNDK